MSDVTYQDRNGKRWFSYQLKMLDGEIGTMLHPEGADMDMADCELHEVVAMVGPLTEVSS